MWFGLFVDLYTYGVYKMTISVWSIDTSKALNGNTDIDLRFSVYDVAQKYEYLVNSAVNYKIGQKTGENKLKLFYVFVSFLSEKKLFQKSQLDPP